MSVTLEHGSISAELDGINLGDKRLNKRCKLVIDALAVDPQLSINAACDGWNETHAAYELLDHSKATPAKILHPHQLKSLDRVRQHQVVLIPQDTTELDYTAHPPKDARCLNKQNRFGFYEHVELAVTPNGLTLGVLGTQSFDRDPDSLGVAHDRRPLPIEDKESHRWLQGYQHACELQALCPNTTLVSIADREGDIYDLFVEHRDHDGPRAEFITRAKQARSTVDRDFEAGPRVFCKVLNELRESPLLGTRTIELPATPKREARNAVLELRALTVTVKPPHGRAGMKPVAMNVVLVEEVGGPGDGTDVSWQLLTSLPIDTLEAAWLVVDYYRQRWQIEVYFRTLKTGCRVEDMRLERNARLKNALALYEVIAWRILYLMHLNRTDPDIPCNEVFAEHEWKSVWFVTKKTPPPLKPPTLAEFLRQLTSLGGYNNRATERPPGPLPFWIGLRRMHDLAIAFQIFKNLPER